MMRPSFLAAAAATFLAIFAPGSGSASSCGNDVAKLEQSLERKGASAGAAQSSGQKDAAARSSQAIEARKADVPVADLPGQSSKESIAGAREAAAADAAGEGVMAAKVSLNDARNADRKGDEPGCRKAFDAAKRASGS